MKSLFQWLQALLLAQKFCCAVWSKSSHILPPAVCCCRAQEAATVVLPSCWYKCLSPRRGTRGKSTYLAIRRDSHKKTNNVNTSHLLELVKAKAFYSTPTGSKKKIREISGIQIVKGFVLNSEYLRKVMSTSNVNFLFFFQLIAGGKEV